MSTLNGIISPSGGGGSVSGDITATKVDVDNLRLDGNTISSTNSNGNINLTPNGTGQVSIPHGSLTAPGLTIPSNSATGLHVVSGGTESLNYIINSVPVLFSSATRIRIPGAAYFGWVPASDTNANEIDTSLHRHAAGVIRIGDGSTGNGSLSIASGSAGSPSIRFTDDSDTGFCQTGSGRIQATVNGVVALTVYDSATGMYPAGPVVGSGTSAVLYGFVKNVEANTAGSGSPNVITADETGKVFTNEGSTAENYHTLPTAVTGHEFTFIVQDTDGIRITAASGDTIRPIAGTAASATGGFIRCATAGAFVRLQAINATEWIATGSSGVWTIDV